MSALARSLKRSFIDKSFLKQERFATVSEDIDYTLKVWMAEVLRGVDTSKKRNSKIVKSLKKSIKSKNVTVGRNQKFLQVVAKFVHCELKQEPNKAWADILGIVTEPVEGMKTFKESLMQLTKNLYMIEKFSELEIERLRVKAHTFILEKSKNPRANRKEIKGLLKYAKQCAIKERTAKTYHEKAVKTVVEPDTPLSSKLFKSTAGMRWNEAMTKAQYLQAQNLTQEAITKCNAIIRSTDKQMKLDMIDLLTRYIEIEMIQHCKALEHLTEAFKMAQASRAAVTLSNKKDDVPQVEKPLELIKKEPERLYKAVPSPKALSEGSVKSFSDLFCLVPQYSSTAKEPSPSFKEIITCSKKSSEETRGEISEEEEEEEERHEETLTLPSIEEEIDIC